MPLSLPPSPIISLGKMTKIAGSVQKSSKSIGALRAPPSRMNRPAVVFDGSGASASKARVLRWLRIQRHPGADSTVFKVRPKRKTNRFFYYYFVITFYISGGHMARAAGENRTSALRSAGRAALLPRLFCSCHVGRATNDRWPSKGLVCLGSK